MDVTITHDPDRGGRQQVAIVGMTVLMLAVGAFGVWMIVASVQQYWPGAEAWIGSAFGLLFVGVALVSVISAVEGFIVVRRDLSTGTVLVRADQHGIHHRDGSTTAWGDIDRLELRASGVRAPRTNRLAQLDSGHQVSVRTKGWLDRHVGEGMAIKDGSRVVRVLLKAGSSIDTDVTLALGTAGFVDRANELKALADEHGVGTDIVVT